MAKVPALAAMSNVEKQQMHDWLVCMGGFSLTNYLDAKQNRDAQALATIKDFADYSMRIVLGVEGVKVSLAGSRLTVAAPPVVGSTSVAKQIVGAWTFAASAQLQRRDAPEIHLQRRRHLQFQVRTQLSNAEMEDG